MAKAAIIDDIHDNVSARLDEVQSSLANHRKNCVALYKLHVQASKVVQGKDLAGEVAFEDEFLQMMARVLVVKKGQTAERVVRFVGTYVRHVTAKGAWRDFCAGGRVADWLQKLRRSRRRRARPAQIHWRRGSRRGC